MFNVLDNKEEEEEEKNLKLRENVQNLQTSYLRLDIELLEAG